MTSSLVGSEMCIRDRSSSSSRREAASFLAYVLRMLMRMNFDEDFVPCKGCLLYTSDAADECSV
eukprot:12642695-Prorocentrum_lima.AAC.1